MSSSVPMPMYMLFSLPVGYDLGQGSTRCSGISVVGDHAITIW